MTLDVLSVKSRLILARSIWLINCCMMTCSILAILRSSNKIFCAFFNVSSIDNISVKILIESNFFLNVIWRFLSVSFFRVNKASSFWLEVDKSIAFVSLIEVWISSFVLFRHTSSILCSICWSIWFWFNWFEIAWFEFDWFEFDEFKLD